MLKGNLFNYLTLSSQNMNYKDYLRLTERCNAEASIDPLEINGSISLTAAIDVTVLILSKLGIPGVDLLQGLLSILWPSKTTDVWDSLIKTVDEKISAAISEAIRVKALSDLANSGIAVESYLNTLDVWLED
ncbi:hypothetical protein P4K49_27045 [Bacillus cereus]|uniref:hypothetical protein n=2 Tax=Bacillus thuringiensis TaxID=1428 RepID=UPI000676E2BB|nr:hypothetical protein [Bacillus thuringiensis]MEB8879366.1 hypothetical protein [Bacillus cereus]AKR38909.1 Pesticidal crystal protein cry8Ca [Bacillus thuringiensis serovar indiana]MEB9733536.1 hypothetical protein [Bacillus cereus]MRB43006.1 hypothetical protein [Bacillus thuringiensis]MRB84687.1 hypothetical protein [Bacillus thuringiensis]